RRLWRWKRRVPSLSSSCWMRVVTFDCTRCSRAAARVMPPVSATVLKICSATRSMRKGCSLSENESFIIIHFLRCPCQCSLCGMAEQAVSVDATRAPAALALAGLAALAVAIGIGRFAFTPILPMMREDAGLSVGGAGWLASANYAGYLIGALWAAVQPARAPVAIRAGLGAIGVATLGMSLDVGMAGWAALRLVAGIASAWVLIHVSAACLGRLAPLRRPVLEGTVFCGVGVGIVAAGALCAALIAVHAS